VLNRLWFCVKPNFFAFLLAKGSEVICKNVKIMAKHKLCMAVDFALNCIGKTKNAVGR